jgi:hypothetical protein
LALAASKAQRGCTEPLPESGPRGVMAPMLALIVR